MSCGGALLLARASPATPTHSHSLYGTLRMNLVTRSVRISSFGSTLPGIVTYKGCLCTRYGWLRTHCILCYYHPVLCMMMLLSSDTDATLAPSPRTATAHTWSRCSLTT